MASDNIFSGLKVVELASFIAGPGAAVILSDFGADVVKVEPPTGDTWRIGHKIPPQPQAKEAYPFHLANRNKRGVTLDLKSPSAQPAMFYLALVLWPMGDAGRAISLVRDAKARTATLTHIGARAYGMCLAAIFELVCGNLSRAAPHAAELAGLAHEHDLLMWRAYGIFLEGAAKAEGRGLGDMRRGAELLREQKVRTFDGLANITLAEAEARAGDIDRARAILDETLATSEHTGNRQFDVELHRIRGEMLLKRDPANPAAAEEALLTAITVSKQQSTRSFELRAALSIARLYQSTGRPVEGHAVLAPALEGFAATPEMPEIAEAEVLLSRLA
jgi:predicted ATPase